MQTFSILELFRSWNIAAADKSNKNIPLQDKAAGRPQDGAGLLQMSVFLSRISEDILESLKLLFRSWDYSVEKDNMGKGLPSVCMKIGVT